MTERRFTVEEADAELADLRERLPRLRQARRDLIAASERITERVAADGGGVSEAGWFTYQQTLKDDLASLADRGILLRIRRWAWWTSRPNATVSACCCAGCWGRNAWPTSTPNAPG